jgi:hypothetical protein
MRAPARPPPAAITLQDALPMAGPIALGSVFALMSALAAFASRSPKALRQG